ncbi:MAG: TonB-dependent receptor plug domain-containing protein [Bacteroidales bacterium]|jgi:hypothetical protein|nr:TonB-dependent receptor plug domain-containing protein [Bacteroidales bacterium]
MKRNIFFFLFFSVGVAVSAAPKTDSVRVLDAVSVQGFGRSMIDRNTVGTVYLSEEAIKKIPTLLGEADLMKAMTFLPGVIMTSEGSSGFSVRGGSPDQNGIYLDNALIYNPSHAVGFFSVFNNDIISDATLYKGDIPVSFGGQLSSVVDVRQKEGDMKKYHLQGGIGILLSRLMVEGPVWKDHTSFIISGRRTYFDLFLPLVNNNDVKLHFYDINLKLAQKIGKKDKITLSGYMGEDVFGIGNRGVRMNYGNKVLSLVHSHYFSPEFALNTSVYATDYNYELGTESAAFGFDWTAGMTDFGAKIDGALHIGDTSAFQHNISFGYRSTFHRYRAGNINVRFKDVPIDGIENRTFSQGTFKAWENSIFAGNDQKIGEHILVKYGIRLSTFTNIGQDSVNMYDENYEHTSIKAYGKGEMFHTYFGWEPRIGVAYLFNKSMSIKANYSRTTQYSQLAQNSTSGNPLDVWFPANPYIKPQVANNFALGFFKNFLNDEWETSVEGFYRALTNVIDFKDHSNLLPFSIDGSPATGLYGEIRKGQGYAYGVEVMVKRNKGIVNGSVSYTFSRSMRKIDEVNDNKWYPAPYDRPHAINIMLNIKPHLRHGFVFNWVFYSGLPVTYPGGKAVLLDGFVIPVYSDRNSQRMPAYHRLDVAYTLYSNPKSKKRFKWDLAIGVYNAYARKNPWTINFIDQRPEDGDISKPAKSYAEMIYLFSAIPSITFNFKW